MHVVDDLSVKTNNAVLNEKKKNLGAHPKYYSGWTIYASWPASVPMQVLSACYTPRDE